MVAGDVEAFDGEFARDATEEIGREDERSFQQDNDNDGAGGEIGFDFLRHGVEPAVDDLFVDEDTFDVIFHGIMVVWMSGWKRGFFRKGGEDTAYLDLKNFNRRWTGCLAATGGIAYCCVDDSQGFGFWISDGWAWFSGRMVFVGRVRSGGLEVF